VLLDPREKETSRFNLILQVAEQKKFPSKHFSKDKLDELIANSSEDPLEADPDLVILENGQIAGIDWMDRSRAFVP
jgi:hypothetical protein